MNYMNEQRGENFSRRDFLKGAAAALVGMSVGGDSELEHDREAQKETHEAGSLEITYTAVVSEAVAEMQKRGGQSEKHMEWIQKYFHDRCIPDIKKDIKQRFPHASGRVALTLDLTKAELGIKPLEVREHGEQIISEGRTAIEDAIQFWDHPKLARPEQLNFQIPHSRETKRFGPFPADQRLEIDIVDEQGIRYEGQVTGMVENREQKWKFGVFVHNLAGSVERTAKVQQQSDGSRGIVWEHSQIYWVLNGDRETSKNLVRILPTEILHAQLGAWVDARQSEAMIQTGKMEATPASIRPVQLGEAVVHSIGLLWHETYQEKKGSPVTPEERKAILASEYPGVVQLYARLEQNGGHTEVKKLLDDFIDHPELLYKETGL